MYLTLSILALLAAAAGSLVWYVRRKARIRTVEEEQMRRKFRTRKEIVEEVADLNEFEAGLDESSDPGLRAKAESWREAVEQKCRQTNTPITVARRRPAQGFQLPRWRPQSGD